MLNHFGRLLLPGVLLLVSCTAPPEEPADSGRRALIVVDMQYDFLPGGSLPTRDWVAAAPPGPVRMHGSSG